MDSPFDVLGLDRGADEDAIERAYRERVKEAHPDQGGSAAEFRRVRDAYEAITSGEEESAIEPTDAEERTHRARERAKSPDESTPDPEPEDPSERIVEFLDYDVLADHGWEVGDPDLFEKAASAGLEPPDFGRVTVEGDESLLEAAEGDGYSWPFACRGGACANCAVAVAAGDLDQPVDHILPDEMVDRGFRLSCVGAPVTEDTRVVYNVKHLPGLEDLRLPPHPFDRSRASD
jgi:ferredoxin